MKSNQSENINHYRLSTQLQILKTKFTNSNERTVPTVTSYIQKHSEILVLLKSHLVSPGTDAVKSKVSICHASY